MYQPSWGYFVCLSTLYPVPCTMYLVPCTLYPALTTVPIPPKIRDSCLAPFWGTSRSPKTQGADRSCRAPFWGTSRSPKTQLIMHALSFITSQVLRLSALSLTALSSALSRPPTNDKQKTRTRWFAESARAPRLRTKSKGRTRLPFISFSTIGQRLRPRCRGAAAQTHCGADGQTGDSAARPPTAVAVFFRRRHKGRGTPRCGTGPKLPAVARQIGGPGLGP